MATKGKSTEVVRLTHTNGATVVVSSGKAARLLAGAGFSEAKAAAKAAPKADTPADPSKS